MPLLKSLCSQVVFEKKSKQNGIVKVVKYGFQTRLILSGLTQSVNLRSSMSKKMYWRKLVDLYLKQGRVPNAALVLGLGGGTIIHYLSKRFPGAALVSVELDEVVVEAARACFDLDSITNHRIVVANAFDVIRAPANFGLRNKEFDVVFVDLATSIANKSLFGSTPDTSGFLTKLPNLCSPEGFVLFNQLFTKDSNHSPAKFIETVSEPFEIVGTEKVLLANGVSNYLVCGKVRK